MTTAQQLVPPWLGLGQHRAVVLQGLGSSPRVVCGDSACCIKTRLQSLQVHCAAPKLDVKIAQLSAWSNVYMSSLSSMWCLAKPHPPSARSRVHNTSLKFRGTDWPALVVNKCKWFWMRCEFPSCHLYCAVFLLPPTRPTVVRVEPDDVYHSFLRRAEFSVRKRGKTEGSHLGAAVDRRTRRSALHWSRRSETIRTESHGDHVDGRVHRHLRCMKCPRAFHIHLPLRWPAWHRSQDANGVGGVWRSPKGAVMCCPPASVSRRQSVQHSPTRHLVCISSNLRARFGQRLPVRLCACSLSLPARMCSKRHLQCHLS